jgi:predicted nucleic acid-binding Zn ribbon protein
VTEPAEPFDPASLEFTDAPVPNAGASADFKGTEPPKPKRTIFDRPRKANRQPRNAPPALIAAIPNKKGQFIEPLMKLYGGLGAMVMIADPVCGTAIVSSAQKCAETIDQLAYENESVRRLAWMLTRTSTAGMVIVAHLPIIMAMTMHHIPSAQQAFGMLGANMMEEFLKQTTPADGDATP